MLSWFLVQMVLRHKALLAIVIHGYPWSDLQLQADNCQLATVHNIGQGCASNPNDMATSFYLCCDTQHMALR